MPTPSMPSDRRRQWLISHGFLSPSSGPSRRLGGLLPRVGARSTARSADVDVRVGASATPVVVARGSRDRPRVARAVSMPEDEPPAPPSAGPPPVARAASSWVGRGDRAASPPRRRFFRARRRARARKADEERKKEGRQVIKVVDRELPRRVLHGNGADVRFDGTKWNEYREKIDGLKEDRGFMDYLTEGVAERRVMEGKREAIDETQQLAVNKLYPLAFIRLLEAQARFQSDDEEDDDPDAEKHRYDDPERDDPDPDRDDDEGRVMRTASSGIYDMGRFRTVGGNTKEGRRRGSDELVKLLQGRKTDGRRVDRGGVFPRMGRESRITSVPVC